MEAILTLSVLNHNKKACIAMFVPSCYYYYVYALLVYSLRIISA